MRVRSPESTPKPKLLNVQLPVDCLSSLGPLRAGSTYSKCFNMLTREPSLGSLQYQGFIDCAHSDTNSTDGPDPFRTSWHGCTRFESWETTPGLSLPHSLDLLDSLFPRSLPPLDPAWRLWLSCPTSAVTFSAGWNGFRRSRITPQLEKDRSSLKAARQLVQVPRPLRSHILRMVFETRALKERNSSRQITGAR